MDYLVFMKYFSLVLLVGQNTVLVLLMRFTRTQSGDMYAASTAVCVMEVLKLITCLGVVFKEHNGDVRKTLAQLKAHIWDAPLEMAKLSVPSILYTIQNNLLYYALSNLDAATYQVSYQLKILTTALFSVVMLRKVVSRHQWVALLMLTLGVSLAQLSKTELSEQKDIPVQNHMMGFIAVLLAAVTSGFSGVYFEKILKGSATSLWIRNIQMGLPSVLWALIAVFTSDYEHVRDKGFFFGYTAYVWWVVAFQAFGGLVVAVVVKYADNILKGFAASFSIVTSCILEVLLFGFRPTFMFMIGAVLVNVSMWYYSAKPPNQRPDTPQKPEKQPPV